MTVKEDKWAIYDKMEALKQTYQNDLKKLRQELIDLQNKCEHDWSYNLDPSGNNDSSYTCSHCDKEVRRIPK